MNEREAAYQVLQKVEQEGAFASLTIEALRAGERASAFIRTVVLGVLRWRSRLDWIIERLSRRSVSGIDQPALQILRIGVYQLLFMDVPPRAAVFESVALANPHARRAKGFINAVLRSASQTDLQRLLPGGDSPDAVAIRTGHPEWLLRRWIDRYGLSRAASIAESNQNLSFPDVLINTTKITLDEAIDAMGTRGVAAAPSSLLPWMARLAGSSAPLIDEIRSGLLYPMDEGSGVIASLPQAGAGPLLDFSAAPGGKALALTMRGIRVVAHDVSWRRLRPLGPAMRRMFGISARLVVGDGRHPPFRQRFGTVLLDAPCSATGTIRKNPEIKWRLTPEQIGAFASLQRELLDRALELAGEECIYSTCSLEPEENDEVIGDALSRHPEFALADIAERAGEELRRWVNGGVLRLTPEAGTDGFTAFVLMRR